MFYNLFLAHLLADYPLQPTWIVSNKSRRGVLALHVSIHFLTGLVLTWRYIFHIWPYLLLLAGIHFLIDSGKMMLSRLRPEWVKIPYIVDQCIHLISIGIISLAIQGRYGIAAFPKNLNWVVMMIAFLLVTYVWYISERVMTYDEPSYHQSVMKNSWSRMAFRAGFLLGFMGIWLWATHSLATAAGAVYIPYQMKQFGRRALVTDLSVTLSVFILTILILEPPF